MCTRVTLKVLVVIILVVSSGYIGLAQSSDNGLKKDLEEIKQGQQAMRKELLDIKALLSAKQAPSAVQVKDMEFDIGKRPVRGSDTAQLLLVEFTDYQCQYCGRHVRETFPKIAEEYIDKGVIRYAVADQPLSMHKMAAKAAEASRCAGEQGKFWEYHNLTMSKQDWIEDLSSYAISLKLNVDQYESCLKTNKYGGEVEKDAALATRLGVTGTPGFILAYSDPQHPTKAKGISYIRGAQPFSSFQKEIEHALGNKLMEKGPY